MAQSISFFLSLSPPIPSAPILLLPAITLARLRRQLFSSSSALYNLPSLPFFPSHSFFLSLLFFSPQRDPQLEPRYELTVAPMTARAGQSASEVAEVRDLCSSAVQSPLLATMHSAWDGTQLFMSFDNNVIIN